MSAAYYGMHSKSGNARVHEIVRTARDKNLKWRDVEVQLYKLCANKKYMEAYSSYVRDTVYVELMESNGYTECGRIL